MLGENYLLVSKNDDEENFKHWFDSLFNNSSKKNSLDGDCYAIIVLDGNTSIPLYKGESSYIMTHKGSTYANVSY